METNIVNFNNFKFEYFIKDDMATSSIENKVEWEPHITYFVKLYNSINKIENIIDIGANFGYHSLLFSKEVLGFVYSFEPQIQNYNLLINNIKHNNITNIIPYNFACGDIECDIYMPIINTTNYSINMGDFTPNYLLNNYSYSITKSIKLDNLNLPKIDLIKIDVQGWEKKVLEGSINLLNTYKPILIVEFEESQLNKTNTTCEDLFNYIRNNNYYIFYLYYKYPSDHICVHNDKLQEFRNQFKDYIFFHNDNNNINRNIEYNVTEKLVFI